MSRSRKETNKSLLIVNCFGMSLPLAISSESPVSAHRVAPTSIKPVPFSLQAASQPGGPQIEPQSACPTCRHPGFATNTITDANGPTAPLNPGFDSGAVAAKFASSTTDGPTVQALSAPLLSAFAAVSARVSAATTDVDTRLDGLETAADRVVTDASNKINSDLRARTAAINISFAEASTAADARAAAAQRDVEAARECVALLRALRAVLSSAPLDQAFAAAHLPPPTPSAAGVCDSATCGGAALGVSTASVSRRLSYPGDGVPTHRSAGRGADDADAAVTPSALRRGSGSGSGVTAAAGARAPDTAPRRSLSGGARIQTSHAAAYVRDLAAAAAAEGTGTRHRRRGTDEDEDEDLVCIVVGARRVVLPRAVAAAAAPSMLRSAFGGPWVRTAAGGPIRIAPTSAAATADGTGPAPAASAVPLAMLQTAAMLHAAANGASASAAVAAAGAVADTVTYEGRAFEAASVAVDADARALRVVLEAYATATPGAARGVGEACGAGEASAVGGQVGYQLPAAVGPWEALSTAGALGVPLHVAAVRSIGGDVVARALATTTVGGDVAVLEVAERDMDGAMWAHPGTVEECPLCGLAGGA